MPSNDELMKVIRTMDLENKNLQEKNMEIQRVADKFAEEFRVLNRSSHSAEYELISARNEIAELNCIVEKLSQWMEMKKGEENGKSTIPIDLNAIMSKLETAKIDLGSLRNSKTAAVTSKNAEIAILRAAINQLRETTKKTTAKLVTANAKINALESVIQDTLVACTEQEIVNVAPAPSGEGQSGPRISPYASQGQLEAAFDNAVQTGDQKQIDMVFHNISGRSQAERVKLFCRLRHQNGKK